MEKEIIQWLIFAAFSGVIWFMKKTISDQETQTKDLKHTVDYIKEKYLHKDDFKEFKVELRSMFEELKKDIRNMQHSQNV